jgi:glycosyltransferase involved in cell wall biosynthesis
VESFHQVAKAARPEVAPVEVALLTGGTDRHYTYGLAMSLVSSGVHLDIVGGPGVDSPEMHVTPGLNFLSLRTEGGPRAGVVKKGSKLLAYYARLVAYAWSARPKIFHILWNNRVLWFDRTLLMLYYRMLGKKMVFTAHNVNKARRDERDSAWNRLTLKIQYRLAHRIFVHTQKMKDELIEGFGVAPKTVTIIPYGINNAVPPNTLKPAEAKHRLGISQFEKTILFFGNMRASKGLDYLLSAFEQLKADGANYRLIVAGAPQKADSIYWARLLPVLRRLETEGSLILKQEFIPDEDIPMYFAAADVLALPYTEIFQSGVLFLGYSYGIPVIATDVGELRKDIVEGRTGLMCKPCNAGSLAEAIQKYFASDLFRELDSRRDEIRNFATERHSWSDVAVRTRSVYSELSDKTRPGSF